MRDETALRIRRAGRHEARAAAEILLRSRHASVPAIPPLVHAEDDAKEHFAETIRQSADVWVVEADDTIAGVMVLNGNWVDQLYIDPDRTGQGLGSSLIDKAKTVDELREIHAKHEKSWKEFGEAAFKEFMKELTKKRKEIEQG